MEGSIKNRLNRRALLQGAAAGAGLTALVGPRSFVHAVEASASTEQASVINFVKRFTTEAPDTTKVDAENFDALAEQATELVTRLADETGIEMSDLAQLVRHLYAHGYYFNLNALNENSEWMYPIDRVTSVPVQSVPAIAALLGDDHPVLGETIHMAHINAESYPTDGSADALGNVLINEARANAVVDTFNGSYDQFTRRVDTDDYLHYVQVNELWHLVFKMAFPKLTEQHTKAIASLDDTEDQFSSYDVIHLDEFMSDATVALDSDMKIPFLVQQFVEALYQISYHPTYQYTYDFMGRQLNALAGDLKSVLEAAQSKGDATIDSITIAILDAIGGRDGIAKIKAEFAKEQELVIAKLQALEQRL